MGRAGERWKLLARGEIGYTDAQVDERRLDVDGTELILSVTQLPNFYRFKAGGSSSVRGYGFERPYGLAWLLQLAAELSQWPDEQAGRWSAALQPLTPSKRSCAVSAAQAGSLLAELSK